MSRTLPNHPASKCHPSVLPAARPRIPETVGEAVGVIVGGGVVGGGVVGGGVVGGGVGGELLVAGAEGDLLVDGADFVGFGDGRPLDVGLAVLVAVGVFGAVPRLVPRPPPPTVVVGSEAVVGDTVWLADWLGWFSFPVFPVVLAVGVRLLVSTIAMIAMIPQAARLTPAISKPRRLGREPPGRSGSPL
jgi:hypothetical protein